LRVAAQALVILAQSAKEFLALQRLDRGMDDVNHRRLP
jgi:hypothetical protein